MDVTEHYLIEEYSNGRISKGKAAKMLDISIYEINDLFEKHRVKDSISYENFIKGMEIAEKYSKYGPDKEKKKE
ncbi:hypothetical protein [Methanolobus psychrotolerans]|uniref:hypothetical protein n=1 Tax=Methanolobus psychrotolerans TaxID=1874706 RepID=UPI001A9179D3|nr:hypothetical protein [Methanolobus psychrotolerans]